jgi:hypothetical protein
MNYKSSPIAAKALVAKVERDMGISETAEELAGLTDCPHGCSGIEPDGYCPHGFLSATHTLIQSVKL